MSTLQAYCRRAALRWLAWALLLATPLLARGEEPAVRPPGQAPPSGLYRRAYVPAGRAADWPFRATRYWPMAADEFQQLVSSASPASEAGAPNVVLSSAVLEAHWQADRLQGIARLEIERLDPLPGDPREQSGDLPGPLLELLPAAIRWGEASWTGEAAQVAVIGGTARGPAVLVPKSGTLQWRWQLTPQKAADPTATGLTFLLGSLPTASVQWRFRLPAQWQPTLSGGVLSGGNLEPSGERLWQADLFEHPAAQLTVRTEPASPTEDTTFGWQETLHFRLGRQETTVAGRWELPASAGEPTQFALHADPAWEALEVRWADQLLSPVEAAADQRPGVYHYELPPAGPGEQAVEVRARSVTVVDRPWRLPRLELASPGWQQGTRTLTVLDPLAAEDLRLNDARIVSTRRLTGSPLGEQWELQCFAPSATATVRLATRPAPLSSWSVTRITPLPGQLRGTWQAEFEATEGERYLLDAAVPRPWLVDQVSSVPAEALADWRVDTTEQGDRRLRVSLRRPVTTSERLRLEVSGRLLRAPSGELALSELTMIRLDERAAAARLLALANPEALPLRASGPLERFELEWRQLSEEQQRLLGEPGSYVFVAPDRADPSIRVAYRSEAPRISGQVTTRVRKQGSLIQQEFLLSCRAEQAPVRTLWVAFSQSTGDSILWVLGPGNTPLSARRLTAAEQAERDWQAAAEVWQLTLPAPTRDSFELRGTRGLRWTGGAAPLTLPAICDSTSGSGRLVLTTRSGGLLRGDSPDSALPELLPDEPEFAGSLIYEYRTDDLWTARLRELRLVPESPAAASQPLVWRARLQSRIAEDGPILHQARYDWAPAGQTSFDFRLPPESQLQRAFVDGRPVVPRRDGPGWRLITANPAEVALVELQWTGPALERGVGWRVSAPWPDLSLPVLDSQWAVATAPPLSVQSSWFAPVYGAGAHPTWPQRLAGPWGGNRDDSPAWRRWLDSWLQEPGTESPDAEASFDALWRQSREALSAEPGAATWGQMLSAMAERARRTNHEFWIDAWALSAQGCSPSGPLPETDEPGSRLLSWVGLDRLETPSGGILLTMAGAAEEPADGAARGLRSPTARPLGDARLGQSQWRQVRQRYPGRYVSASQWVQGGEPFPLQVPPGRANSALLGAQANSRGGWTLTVWPTEPGRPTSVWIVHRPSTLALGWGTMLLMAALGGWLALSRRPAATALAAGCLLAALGAPDSWVPVTTGAWLGSLLGLVLPTVRWLAPWEATPSAVAEASVGRYRVATAVGLVLVALGGAARLAAQVPAAAVPEVLIPVDGQRQPTSDPWQVPDELYQLLVSRARQERARAGTLCIEADYELTLAEPGGNTTPLLAPREIEARFEVVLVEPGERIRLALEQSQVELLPEGVTVDGQPTTAQWVDQGSALEVVVFQPGWHTVRLKLAPTSALASAAGRMAIRLPRVPRATCRVRFPVDAWEVRLPQAEAESSPGHRHAATLAWADRLEVLWFADSADGQAAQPSGEQLTWLQVGPGATSIQLKLRLRFPPGGSRQCRLRLDPNLPPRPLTAHPGGQVVEGRAGSSRGELLLEIPAELGAEVELEGRWPWEAMSGIGRLQPPRVELVEPAPSRQWLALSVDPNLDYRQDAAEAVVGIPPAQFLKNWGSATAEPNWAARSSEPMAPWILSTRPRPTQLSVVQTSQFEAALPRPRVRSRARISLQSGVTFLHHLQMPGGWRVDELAVLEDGSPVAARWSQDDQGQVVVFLSAPCGPEQEVHLTISREAEGSDRPLNWSPPAWSEASEQSDQVQILASQQTEFAVTEAAGWNQLDLPTAKVDQRRVSSHWSCQGPPPAMQFTLRENLLAGRIWQMTTLVRQGANWEAAMVLRPQLSQGRLSVLRFELPHDWRDLVCDDPTVSLLESEDPKRQRRILTLELPDAAPQKESSWTVRARLELAAGAAPRLAVPLPLDSLNYSQLLVLPAQLDRAPARWSTQGVRPAVAEQLPRPLPFAPVAPQAYLAYRVVDDSASAVLSSATQTGDPRRLTLAEYDLEFTAASSYQGVVRWTLPPGAPTRLELAMPAQLEPVEWRCNSRPAAIQAIGPNRWVVTLPAEPWGHAVEVLFRTQSGVEPSPGTLPVPGFLGDFPVQAVWTIRDRCGRRLVLDAASQLSPWKAAIFRLGATVGALTPGGAAGTAPPSLATAPRYWQHQLAVRRAAAQAALDQLTDDDERLAARTELEAAEGLLGQASSTATVSESAASATTRENYDLLTRWRQSDRLAAPASTWRPAESDAALRYHAAWPWDRLARWGAKSLLLLVLAGGFWLLAGRPDRPLRWLRRRANWLGLAASAVWSLGFWPAPLGWLAAAYFLGRLAMRRQARPLPRRPSVSPRPMTGWS